MTLTREKCNKQCKLLDSDTFMARHKHLAPIEYAKRKPGQTVLIFLDEINTSPDIGGFKEVVCDHSLKGVEFPNNVVIIAALNPYRKRVKTIEEIKDEENEARNNVTAYTDKLDAEMSDLVYRVFPLPPSMKLLVWNFGSLSKIDEEQYIAVMTDRKWIDMKQNGIVEIDGSQWDRLKQVFTKLICSSQEFVR